ncbi:DEAD/DEAH box helicase family protein [Vibrio parahaemolyticus]|nr:DEAD/DEAH box helicase family protein [Vibrio parahaemolyticus]
MTSTLREMVANAASMDELFHVFDIATSGIVTTRPSGSRAKINEQAVEILKRIQDDFSQITEEEKAIIREYSGEGGIGASTNEYYTPPFVAKATWSALEAYGFKNGNVLEPSAGVGIFASTKPNGVIMTSVEMSPISSGINQILHPEDKVINSAFEAFAKNPENSGYDAVIGNPPFGVRDDSQFKDEEYKDIALADQYFVTRSIDKAAPGGIIGLILPTRIVDRKSFAQWRLSLSLKAEFLGAHRLPNDIFKEAGTAVVTDLVLWRKHSAEAKDIIDAADIDVLRSSNVLWDTWIDGKWFERDGKKFINGTQTTVGEGKFKRLVVDRGSKTNDQITKSLAHKFDSRIDWSELSTVEPITNVYGEGDSRMINGRMVRMENGQWVAVSTISNTGELDVTKFGVDNISGVSSTTFSDSSLKLSFSQCTALYEELGYACDEQFKIAMREVRSISEKHQERVFRGIVLGRMVRNLSDLVANGTTEQIDELRTKVANLVTAEFKRFGSTRNIKKLNSLSPEQRAEWSAFDNAFNDQGELSELLQGNLSKSDAKQFNMKEPDDVLLWFDKVEQTTAISIEQFKDAYSGELGNLSTDEMLNQLAGMPNIAINQDGTLSSLHKATSGNVVKRLELLNQAIASSTNPALTANYQRQIELINQKRNRISINDMQMKLTDKWLPKELLLEFLHSRGYSEFMLGKEVEIDGELQFDPTYRGEDAVFSGYRFRDGKKRNATDEAFERQIESYINDGAVRGGAGSAGKAAVRDQMRQLDSDLTDWAASGDYADRLEDQYNNVFNGYIEPEHDTGDLELTGVSGAIEFMGYQNATIRRHSDDGNGIIGFGTGLGKTLTGLGLIQYNHQKGRAKRTAVVVPKSVLENWFYESDLFFGEENLKDKVFVGLEPEYDKDGKLAREPVLDEDGKPKLDKKGEPILRAKLKIDTSSAKVADKLHSLTQSNASMVIMTKDVYNSIPMRESTIADNVEEMVDAGLVANSNKYVQMATKHREQAKNSRFRAKYADEGTKKKNQLPYFEDLLFDSVMVDEGHDFRNSYKTGSFANRLAFMPNGAQADRALDMQIKNNFLKRRNSGRGVYMLTATPTVNSPVDAFNMLSHVVPPETFAKMGITDGDDFIRLFGRTGETAVHKLSGEMETKEALLGFQNLDALRKLFHRYVTVKDIKDVNAEVHIPDLDVKTNYVDMSEEQTEIYEELRARAEALSNPDTDEAKAIVEEFPDDSVFSIIRQMDKACTDLDLYKGVVTYRFPKSKEVEVREMISSVPTEMTVKRRVLDEKSGKYKNKNVKIDGEIDIAVEGKFVVVTATQELDQNIADAADSAGLTFSHPVAPKYAKFLENAKEVYLAGGKQLVFTEEKTQHVKLARIISQYVGCKISEIGIINSDTVAGKKGASVDDGLDEAGLEAIAKEYNTGRYKFVILNKKGEVGINLHHGTTDIHHLTLPFTPASLTQRNGRGARVGSKQGSVNVHYYAGKGSFDKFRISTIERKARWINDLFNGTDKAVENGDAESANETAIMLSADPEEAKRRQEAANAEREKKLLQEKQRRASIATGKYLQAVEALSVDTDKLQSELASYNERIEKQEATVQDAIERANGEYAGRWEKDRVKHEKKRLFDLRADRLKVSKTLDRVAGAADAKKRFEPDVKRAVAEGILSDYEDIFVAPESYMASNGKVVRKGLTYVVKTLASLWDEKGAKVENIGTVVDFDNEGARVLCLMLTDNGSERVNSKSWVAMDDVIRLADVNQSEQQLISKARAGMNVCDIANELTREQFYKLIEDEDLTSFSDARGGVAVVDGELKHTYTFKGEWEMLYPDVTDEGMKNRILDTAIKEIEANGRTQLENIMTAYVGPDWNNLIYERGNTATPEYIQSKMMEVFAKCETTHKLSYDKALNGDLSDYETNLRTEMNSLDWEGFVNRAEIRQSVNCSFNTYYDVVRERSREHIKAGQDAAFAEYTAKCASDSSRNERLQAITELMRKYKREYDFADKCEDLYPVDDTLAAIAIFADLTAIARKAPLTTGELLYSYSRNHVRSNAMWEWKSIFRSFKSTFIQAMDELLGHNEPIVEDVPVTEMQKEKIDNLNNTPLSFEQMVEELKGIGITAKLNSETLVHQFKRKKTELPAGGYIGLFDVNGRSGALGSAFAGRANAENKSTYSALYSADISEEFTGSWWFVPASVDITALTELLKDEA